MRAELLAYVFYYAYIFYYKLCLSSGTYSRLSLSLSLSPSLMARQP